MFSLASLSISHSFPIGYIYIYILHHRTNFLEKNKKITIDANSSRLAMSGLYSNHLENNILLDHIP